jgi:hypothetical protein
MAEIREAAEGGGDSSARPRSARFRSFLSLAGNVRYVPRRGKRDLSKKSHVGRPKVRGRGSGSPCWAGKPFGLYRIFGTERFCRSRRSRRS